MLIAVGDQRRERVHMVRVLYHWNLIRLRGRRGVQRETVIKREKRGGEKKRKKAGALISGLRVFRLLPHNYNSIRRLSERGAIEFWVLSRCQTSKPQ